MQWCIKTSPLLDNRGSLGEDQAGFGASRIDRKQQCRHAIEDGEEQKVFEQRGNPGIAVEGIQRETPGKRSVRG